MVSSLLHRNTLKYFISEIDAMGFSELFNHEIPLLIAVYSPYIHNQWSVQDRFKVILDHYQMIQRMPSILNLVDARPKILLDLNQYSAGTLITLDKAKWFVREGELVLNIFKDDSRLMSVAFTFSTLNDKPIMYIGAIQGKQSSSETLQLLKEQSKKFEGLRPADLLLEVLRMIAIHLNITKILAISDENRHHRHKHFSHLQSNLLKTNYNERWIENQGIPLENGFYSLPIKKPRKDLAEIGSNKRATYRRRYNILDAIEVALNHALQTIETESASSYFAQPKTNADPEITTLASAIYNIANDQILFGEIANAKRIFKLLMKNYPNTKISRIAQERLIKLDA